MNPASLQAMFTTFKAQGDVVTLHTADPGTNKATARAPGNTDQTTAWPAGSNGSGTGSMVACPVTVAAPTSPVNVSHVCLWHSSGQHVATYRIVDGGGVPFTVNFTTNGVLNVTPTLTVLAA
ncbi:hypothetical protein ACLQ3K_22220 [Tsukamurella sp. DT100]|uniref:hypothetical protein n=1 Tax=Tsukamurella sp. DT100 TaxID=3393415 RepID=UPI003CE8FEDE